MDFNFSLHKFRMAHAMFIILVLLSLFPVPPFINMV